jgi:predicted nucleotide-binding protein
MHLSSGLLIRGFGVQVPGGAPVLTWDYSQSGIPRTGDARGNSSYNVGESVLSPYRAGSAGGRGDTVADVSAGRDAYVAGRDLTITNHAVASVAADDPARKVFVVHGRNAPARSAMFAFLRAIGLNPIEWSEAVQMTGEGSPYIGQVLDTAFDSAQAIVVLFTPDDVAYLRGEYASGEDDPEIAPKGQARPNVLFEAGMAMGRDAKRTVLVELGQLRPFSDIGGRHAIRIDNSAQTRHALAQRLLSAGCAVNLTGSDWLTAGEFVIPPLPM